MPQTLEAKAQIIPKRGTPNRIKEYEWAANPRKKFVQHVLPKL